MGKKTEKLRRLVNKLASRYGEQDVDVMRLKADLATFQDLKVPRIDRRAVNKKEKFDFRSSARRAYDATIRGETH